MTFPRLLPALGAVLILCARDSAAQRAMAQTVINIPPSQPLAEAPANTIVNVLPGGSLHGGFRALAGSTVNIAGGNAPNVLAQFGSRVNVSGGELNWIQLHENSTANISGGFVSDQIFSYGTLTITGGRVGSMVLQPNGETFHSTSVVTGGAIGRIFTTPGAALTLEGVDFALNGELVPGLTNVGDSVTLNLAAGDGLTAILADGRAFGYGEAPGGPYIAPGTLTLKRSLVPPAPTPSEFVVTNPSDLEWIGAGQSLHVKQGGRMPRLFRAGPGSEVFVEGGFIGQDFHSVGAAVTVESGGIESGFKGYGGATITLNGGRLAEADYFHGSELIMQGGEAAFQRLRVGSVANIHGGILYSMYADAGSIVNVHGGERVEVSSGGKVNIFGGNVRLSVGDGDVLLAGGAFSDDFQVAGSSSLTIEGSDFWLNGLPVGGLVNPGDVVNIGNVKPTDVLSGVLSDGTPFALSPQEADDLPTVFQVRRGPDPAPGPAVINVPSVPAPLGVRSGQTLNLGPGGSLGPNFTAGRGSTVNITGGTVGENFDAIGATVNTTGGKLHSLTVYHGADVAIAGTTEWGGARVRTGGKLTIAGDRTQGGGILAEPGSVVDIIGGRLYGIEAHDATITFAGQTSNGSYIEGGSLTVTGGHLRGVTLDGTNAIATGGVISGVQLQDQGQLRVQGASVSGISVGAGTLFEMDSGNLASSFSVQGTIRIRGGALGDRQEWTSGLVELHGEDFQVDGVPVAGLTNVGDTVVFNYAPGTHFSGTLADGTPFAFEGMDNFRSLATSNSALRLVRSTIAPTPDLHVPNDAAPDGAAPGQRVVVVAGGALGDHFVAGRDSHVEIRGGSVGVNFEVDRSVVAISGGAVGEHLDVLAGGVLNVSGGTIDRHWQVWKGGTLNVSGGELNFQGVVDGGRINQSGGVVHGLDARGDAEVIVAGGNMASELQLYDAARATINGGEVSILRIHAGGAAQVSGGRVRYFNLETDASGEVLGGVVNQLYAEPGSTVEVAGGSLGDDFNVEYASHVTLRGVGFAINGATVSGLDAVGDEATITIGEGEVFSGTWADGTPFVMTSAEGERLGAVRLVRSAEPAAGPPLIDVAAPSALRGVRGGQHVRLSTGGSLGEHFSAGSGSAVTITGGSIDRNFEAYDADVSISGGQIAAQFGAFGASRVHMTGGQIAIGMAAYAESEIEISGGQAASIAVRNDALLRVSGGQVDRVTTDAGGRFELSGGTVGRLAAASGSHNVWRGGFAENLTTQGTTTALSIHGAQFHLNGAPLPLDSVGASLKINVRRADVLTGVLADGTPLALRPNSPQGTFFADGTVQVVLSPAPPAPQPDLEVVTQDRPRALLGEGQQLQLKSGRLDSGSIAGFGSAFAMEGGTLGANFRAAGSSVDIRGGTIESGFAALHGTDLLVTGGQFESGLILTAGSHASIFGGQYLSRTHRIESGAVFDLFGVDFHINGQPIAELAQAGTSTTLTQRGQSVLTAIMADGTTTRWDMFAGDAFLTPMSPNAVVRLHRIAPSELPGDFDDNGVVDGSDFLVWQQEDGTPAHLAAWKARFGDGLSAADVRSVPEPGAAGMMLGLALGVAALSRKRGRAGSRLWSWSVRLGPIRGRRGVRWTSRGR